MKAMILAAGLGTRLGRLTENRPKALVTLQGKPLLGILIEKLIACKFDEIIVNIHHHAQQIKDYLAEHKNFNIHIDVSDESGQLLDTGGGIKQAAWFFNDGKPFLVHNVDIISNINLQQLYDAHVASGAMATLACADRPSSRYFLFDRQNRLCGWQNVKTGEQKITIETPSLKPMAFNGIHIINPELLHLLPNTGAFSIVDAYLQLSPTTLLKGFDTAAATVVDIGKPETLAQLQHSTINI